MFLNRMSHMVLEIISLKMALEFILVILEVISICLQKHLRLALMAYLEVKI